MTKIIQSAEFNNFCYLHLFVYKYSDVIVRDPVLSYIFVSKNVMIFTKACEYGIKAAVYIAEQSMNGNRASLKDIAKEIDSPEAFTAKILQTLARNNIINSVKGSTGGFEADLKKIKKTKLIEIVLAIDGTLHEERCVLGLSKCSEVHPCPVHNKYKHIKKDILTMLEKTTLAEMSNSVIEGLSCLRN